MPNPLGLHATEGQGTAIKKEEVPDRADGEQHSVRRTFHVQLTTGLATQKTGLITKMAKKNCERAVFG